MQYDPKTVKDSLSFFSEAASLRTPMVAAISAVQSRPPHEQILGIAAALNVLCEGIGKNPVEIIQQINRATSDIDSAFATQYRAMAEYAKGEFL